MEDKIAAVAAEDRRVRLLMTMNALRMPMGFLGGLPGPVVW